MTEVHSYGAPPPYPDVLRFKHAVDRSATITCVAVGSMETLPRSPQDPIFRCFVSTPGSDLPLAGKYNAELSDIVITCGGGGNHDCRMNRIRERPGAPANLVLVVDCAREGATTKQESEPDVPEASDPAPGMVDPETGLQGEVLFRPPPIPDADLTCLRTLPLFQAGGVYVYPHGPAGL